MSHKKAKKEINDYIFKFQKEDINKKLIKIFGGDFKKYRDDYDKTQNYQETKFLPDFPLSIYIEMFNRCNLNCVMCYKKHHLEEKAELSLKILKKILAECKKNKLPSFIFGHGAEPLLYKDIKEAVRMAHEAGMQDLFFATNGVFMDDEIIKLFFNNKVTRVEISLDAATEETYNKVRRVPVLSKVEANIEKLIKAKKKNNSELPLIRLCFVVMEENKHEIPQFIEKWKDKVDYIDFQRFIDVSHIDEQKEINGQLAKNSFCALPFCSLTIWANGDISPCCTFYAGKLAFGNIYKDSLSDVWYGEKMKNFREQIASGKFNLTCRKCLYYRDRDLVDDIFKK